MECAINSKSHLLVGVGPTLRCALVIRVVLLYATRHLLAHLVPPQIQEWEDPGGAIMDLKIQFHPMILIP